MARRSASRLGAVLLLAAAVALLAPSAFVPTPSTTSMQRGSAAVATGALMLPQMATAAEQAYDQFSPAELVAITIPFVLVALSYSEWEGYQIPTDQELGPGTLRKARNGPGGSKGATLMGDSPVGFEIK
mmetsp:Transcript_50742/g.120619  ORF Transcript_50742/g.120619 Transcript_50742/m.120619 type:complete len:129 (+) Transcript_50742:101-487(+)|eukprot:CAMPEP_0178413716 /NCGR_PEP_ID=MMETSP0689_2-20121128/22670_1 /TAXON_ID=160604 /ORGANISM="Amphidinium massartii, Strain CS-259" /LENGTH=128 /DNA_ID=CAMNT_0020034995 /DNA_START=97 /DNA_END=483 /DNA_ORIENTATION=+